MGDRDKDLEKGLVLADAAKARERKWTWDGQEGGDDIPDPCDYESFPCVPETSALGDTLIQLAGTYEGHREDCAYLAHAATDYPRLLDEIGRLRDLANAALYLRDVLGECDNVPGKALPALMGLGAALAGLGNVPWLDPHAPPKGATR